MNLTPERLAEIVRVVVCSLLHFKCHSVIGRGYVGYWLWECQKCRRRYYLPFGDRHIYDK